MNEYSESSEIIVEKLNPSSSSSSSPPQLAYTRSQLLHFIRVELAVFKIQRFWRQVYATLRLRRQLKLQALRQCGYGLPSSIGVTKCGISGASSIYPSPIESFVAMIGKQPEYEHKVMLWRMIIELRRQCPHIQHTDLLFRALIEAEGNLSRATILLGTTEFLLKHQQQCLSISLRQLLLPSLVTDKLTIHRQFDIMEQSSSSDTNDNTIPISPHNHITINNPMVNLTSPCKPLITNNFTSNNNTNHNPYHKNYHGFSKIEQDVFNLFPLTRRRKVEFIRSLRHQRPSDKRNDFVERFNNYVEKRYFPITANNKGMVTNPAYLVIPITSSKWVNTQRHLFNHTSPTKASRAHDKTLY